MNKKIKKLLARQYYTIGLPASFTSKLKSAVKKT